MWLSNRAWSRPESSSTVFGFLPFLASSELAHWALVGDVALALYSFHLVTTSPALTALEAAPVALGGLLHASAALHHAMFIGAHFESVDMLELALITAKVPNKVREAVKSIWVWPKLFAFFPFYMRPSNIVVTRDIPYADDTKNRMQMLDVYHKRGVARDAPVFMFIHGGAWSMGDKNAPSFALWHHLASKGFVVYSINYRLAPKVKLREMVWDCKRALAWIREQGCAQFGGDPKYISVGGESAGGHLSLVLSLTQNDPDLQQGFESKDTSVFACVDLYGAHDLGDFNDVYVSKNASRQKWVESVLLGPNDLHNMAKFSPRETLETVPSEKIPPIFSIHGTNDSLLFVEEARNFDEKLRELRAKGSPRTVNDAFAELPRAAHAYNLFPSLRAYATSYAIEAFLTNARAKL